MLLKRIVSRMKFLHGIPLIKECERFESEIEAVLHTQLHSLGKIVNPAVGFSKLSGYSVEFERGFVDVIYHDSVVTEMYRRLK